ncbi:hypothetical protein NBH00_21615 [Paraconexibacter antarcticus]|uniref:TrbL/VirB6 plasmid conjugal transfer protein n=1 Tax=Paraconexibacter antarcticus TaxID=2949664 RepID=A0ABY5DRP1_9ACTN|nr:hypothetical protein [Paraconexibacter antarcticus]UTI63928.1 hypothetical protein NBH00_21615 [Paraconexibacter antarcticus]
MTRLRILLTLAAFLALVLLWLAPTVWAASDLYSNIGPGGSVSGLADRYPIGNYALDQHFDAIKASLTRGVDASGIPSMIAFFLANLVWQITAFIANALIVIFGYAFSLDLLNGTPGTGDSGALAPVGDAIAGLYAHTFGEPWAVVAITLTGCWAMWRALVQRRYTETAAALGKSLVFCLIALAIVSRPDATIGEASRWTNQISSAFLSVTANGDVSTGPKARRSASDQLFSTLVLRPWVALNFGGTEHCVKPGTGSKDHDPTSVPVRPLPTGAGRRLAKAETVSVVGKECVNNAVRYPAHFLSYPPGSDDRDAQYDAINNADAGKLPDSDPAKKAGTYKPAIFDKPATDAMEKGGQYQRLLLALVVLIGELGAFLLLGSLALSVVLSQIVVLLLACFAPVALVAGIIPGRGHDLFHQWATHLITYLVRKAAYSLVLAVVLAVLAALQDATSSLGWLMSFGLQAALLWTVFLQRGTLVGKLTTAVSGQAPGREAQLRRLLGIAYVAKNVLPARRPATSDAAAGAARATHTGPVDEQSPAPAPEDFDQARHRPTSAPTSTASSRSQLRDEQPSAADAPTREHARTAPATDPATADPDRVGATDRAHRRARLDRPDAPARAAAGNDGAPAATPARRRAGADAHPARRPDRPSEPTHHQHADASPRAALGGAASRVPTPADPGAPDPTPTPPPPRPEPDTPEPSLADQLRAERQRLHPPVAAPDEPVDPAPATRRPPPPHGDGTSSEPGAPS